MDESYKLFWPDADEGGDFARVAARFNATIVPVAAVGAEVGFEMLNPSPHPNPSPNPNPNPNPSPNPKPNP